MGLCRVAARFPGGTALTQQIPALVELHLDFLQSANVFFGKRLKRRATEAGEILKKMVAAYLKQKGITDISQIGIELDPHYLDVTIRRWQAITGCDAIHCATGQRFDDMAQRLITQAESRHGG